MTTSEFIKMLQKADPSGTAHIRMEGGIPLCAELKPGYWDGSYSYIDDDGNYVTSTRNDKIDIHCLSIHDFIEIHEKLTWDEVKKKFKFDLNYSEWQNKEREEVILTKAKLAYDEWVEVNQKCYEYSLKSMIENAERGWRWFQNKDVDLNQTPDLHTYYTWKICKEDGTWINGTSIHQTEPVLKSGLWEKILDSEIEGYYEWVFIKFKN